MYGDTGVMRRRVAQLREQADDLRHTADVLVARTEAVPWTGRAADAMREQVRERALHLRDLAARHDLAADSLDRHRNEVESRKDQIVLAQRRSEALAEDPRSDDEALARFVPPAPGHRDWLDVELPGLRWR